jgi:hypothetical protein
MNTYLNIQIELPVLTQAEIERKIGNLQTFPIHKRIFLRGLYEQWAVLYAPDYHPDQLKRRIKGSSIQLIKKLILNN